MALSRSAFTALAAALALAACGQPAKEAAPPTDPAPAPAPTPEPAAITLSALTEADIAANPLGGELGCSFSSQAGTLLLAQGVVASKDPAQGIVKPGAVERISAPGGFDGMLRGASFTGEGSTVTVAVTGPSTGGGESPPSPAELTYARADGQSVIVPGSWTCGP